MTVTAFIQLFVSKEISLEVGREAYLYTDINNIKPTIIPRVRRSLSSIIPDYDILIRGIFSISVVAKYHRIPYNVSRQTS